MFSSGKSLVSMAILLSDKRIASWEGGLYKGGVEPSVSLSRSDTALFFWTGGSGVSGLDKVCWLSSISLTLGGDLGFFLKMSDANEIVGNSYESSLDLLLVFGYLVAIVSSILYLEGRAQFWQL